MDAKLKKPSTAGDAAMPDARPSDAKLELAARAAWLYHAKGRKQDEIARQLNISRPIVQRLVALAASQNLVRFNLLHPLSACITLAEELRARFNLVYCDVAPSEQGVDDDISAVATSAAVYLENLLQQHQSLTIGVGNGQAMRETSGRMVPISRPGHKFVSLMGNLTRHGRASHYDGVMRLAERAGGQAYPLPMPVVTDTLAEREVLQGQLAYRTAQSLLTEAAVLMMGLGPLGPNEAPMYEDGFITKDELKQAIKAGAIAEILGHAIDREGNVFTTGYNERLTSFALEVPASIPTMIIQTGSIRVEAIGVALKHGIANCLITDENTARLLLKS